MKRYASGRDPHLLALALVGLTALITPQGAAQTPEPPEKSQSLEEEVSALREELEALKRQLATPPRPEQGKGRPVESQGRGLASPGDLGPSGDRDGETGDFEVTPFFDRGPTKPAAVRKIYDKPFLLDLYRKAQIGGYFELEFHGFENDLLGIPRGFRLHRTNLFAFADLADNLQFASEFEFEYEEPGEDIETNVELAILDWTLAQEFVVRVGAILVPLGRINVNHDGPTRELTSRPLVSTFVIPTTLTDPGAGFHGAFDLSDNLEFQYELYVTNGFRILDRDGNLAAPIALSELILREGRPSNGGDDNKSVATSGKLSLFQLEPWTREDGEFGSGSAFDTGVSWHLGNYDERNKNLLALVAGDFAYVKGPLAIEGEVAWAGFERDTFARTAGVPDEFYGYYAQASWSFLPQSWKENAPQVFGQDGSTFTAVARYDWINLDGDRVSALETGINFRPYADTIFKFSYRFGWHEFNRVEDPAFSDNDDSGFVFSLSSYF